MSAISDWVIANSGALMATAAVDGYLLGGGWLDIGIISAASAWWQSWYQTNQPASNPPYMALVTPVLPVVVPMVALKVVLGTPLSVGAMIGMAGFIGNQFQNQVTMDLAQIKIDTTSASS